MKEQMESYYDRHFLLSDGTMDLTPNVTFLTKRMTEQGLICDGVEKDFRGLHIFPVDFFSPKLTTGEYIKDL